MALEPQIAQFGVQRPLACDLVSAMHSLQLAASVCDHGRRLTLLFRGWKVNNVTRAKLPRHICNRLDSGPCSFTSRLLTIRLGAAQRARVYVSHDSLRGDSPHEPNRSICGEGADIRNAKSGATGLEETHVTCSLLSDHSLISTQAGGNIGPPSMTKPL